MGTILSEGAVWSDLSRNRRKGLIGLFFLREGKRIKNNDVVLVLGENGKREKDTG
ncbi:hypothetical protein HAX54_053173, partial [Datura stramonium]|nr:hypothetical protein [Datura stramonium]